LQKILAHAGFGSRRECEEYILQGRVTVDGQVVRVLGTRVDAQHAAIAVDGERIRLERLVYYAVHKPKGYVSTNHDPAGRPRVIDLLPEVPERVYSVGRLDEDTTGLMILTNDGELANGLAHPRYGVEKTYRALVAGSPPPEVIRKLSEGIWLAEGKVRAKHARIVGTQGEATMLELVLAEGKKREIRRMLAKFGHKVMSLTRIAIGPVMLKGLGVGEYRPLSRTEIELLVKVAAGIVVSPPRFLGRGGPGARGKGRPSSRGTKRSEGVEPRSESHGGRDDRAPRTLSHERDDRAPRGRIKGHHDRVPSARRQAGRELPGRDRLPRPDQPAPQAAQGKPIPGKPMTGKPVPGKHGPRKPLPGKPVSGEIVSGKPPPGKPVTGEPVQRKPVEGRPAASRPGIAPGRSLMSEEGKPAAPRGGEPGSPPEGQARPPRRPSPGGPAGKVKSIEAGTMRKIIGLAPKIAADAGLSLSGKPPRKRPVIKRKPPRRVFGIRRPDDDGGEDES
jgi:23S rRNA pseudouridine2605 synthase